MAPITLTQVRVVLNLLAVLQVELLHLQETSEREVIAESMVHTPVQVAVVVTTVVVAVLLPTGMVAVVAPTLAVMQAA
jgi:hypothetical protein